jgi:alpha-N-arabinofuranosidase
VTGIVLAAADPHAHNTFEDPRAVEPKPVAVALKGSAMVHQFPPASVTRLTITLG